MKVLFALLGLLCFLAPAQVLITSPLGKGNGVVFGSGNAIFTRDEITIKNNWVGSELAFVNGLDLVLGAGNFSFLDRHFPYGAIGGIAGLPIKRAGIFVSTYQIALLPLTNRTETSFAIVNSALIVSKTFPIGKTTLAPYAGPAWLFSLGPKDRFLSLPQRERQTAVGFGVFKGKWGLLVEYDHGKAKSVGFAIGRSFKF